mgnify:CR=1 FL=1
MKYYLNAKQAHWRNGCSTLTRFWFENMKFWLPRTLSMENIKLSLGLCMWLLLHVLKMYRQQLSFFMGLIVNFTCLLARCLRTLLQRLLEGKLSCKENCPTPCRFDYDHQQFIDLSYIKINKKFRTYFAADLYICRCSNVWQIVSHVLKTLHICGIKKVCNEINRISSYFGSVWLILYLTWFLSFRF